MQDESIHSRDKPKGDDASGDATGETLSTETTAAETVGGDAVTGGDANGRHAGIDSDPSGGGAVDGEATGDAAVDEALRTLHGLQARPVHEHAATIDSVHRALQDRLADEPADDGFAHQLGEG